jgi:hypothetical protein
MTRDPEVGLGHSRYWFIEKHKFNRPAILHDAGYDAVYMWKNGYNFTYVNRFTEYLLKKHGQEYRNLVKFQYDRLANFYLNTKLFLEQIDKEFYQDCKIIAHNSKKLQLEAFLFFQIVKAFRALLR